MINSIAGLYAHYNVKPYEEPQGILSWLGFGREKAERVQRNVRYLLQVMNLLEQPDLHTYLRKDEAAHWGYFLRSNVQGPVTASRVSDAITFIHDHAPGYVSMSGLQDVIHQYPVHLQYRVEYFCEWARLLERVRGGEPLIRERVRFEDVLKDSGFTLEQLGTTSDEMDRFITQALRLYAKRHLERLERDLYNSLQRAQQLTAEIVESGDSDVKGRALAQVQQLCQQVNEKDTPVE